MDEAQLEKWLQAELHHFLASGDESRMRHAMREDARLRRLQADSALMRSWPSSGASAGPPCTTLVIAFGGLQQRLGGGVGGGVPPYEFVRSCERAGATHAIFVRDATRSWVLPSGLELWLPPPGRLIPPFRVPLRQYLRGLGAHESGSGENGNGHDGNGGASDSFESMVALLRAEVAALRPARLVTIGSSMGGYAAIRVGVALRAHTCITFGPQVT